MGKDLEKINEIIQNYESNNLPVESNKYNALYSDLTKYFIPFYYAHPEDVNDIIYEKNVQSNLNVLIENLEDFYSSVFSNNMIRNRRFVISKYTLASTKLDATDITSSKMTTVRVNITPNDMLSIRSITTLPEPTIRFSKINLPGTDMITKANLNQIFLNYWQLLKKKTNVVDVYVESLEHDLDLDENEFVNGIRNYVINIPDEEIRDMSKKDLYKKYVQSIVPKTRTLFNLMKKYIKGKLSIVDVIGYLEPFLVYTDDLTFKQYEEIVNFIDLKISEISEVFQNFRNF